MILLPALLGFSAGVMIVWGMLRAGMLRDRSGLAVLLAAIAVFYPVFAAAEGDPLAIGVHALIFAGFTFVALRGFRTATYLLAGGLIAHGVFDLALIWLPSPGPAWWPTFCASVDIAAGLLLIRLIQTRKVAQ